MKYMNLERSLMVLLAYIIHNPNTCFALFTTIVVLLLCFTRISSKVRFQHIILKVSVGFIQVENDVATKCDDRARGNITRGPCSPGH